MRFRITVDGEAHEVEVTGKPPASEVIVDGARYRARAVPEDDGFTVRVGPRRHRVSFDEGQVIIDGRAVDVVADGLEEDRLTSAAEGPGADAVVEVRPPMPGRIVKVHVAVGEHVRRGQTLAVLEAMKMQNEIPAPADAVVRAVGVREGESIPSDRVIAVLAAH